jgi:hypothetical protein
VYSFCKLLIDGVPSCQEVGLLPVSMLSSSATTRWDKTERTFFVTRPPMLWATRTIGVYKCELGRGPMPQQDFRRSWLLTFPFLRKCGELYMSANMA